MHCLLKWGRTDLGHGELSEVHRSEIVSWGGGQIPREVNSTLPVLFRRVSLAALSSREPGGLQVMPHMQLIPARLERTYIEAQAAAWPSIVGPVELLTLNHRSKKTTARSPATASSKSSLTWQIGTLSAFVAPRVHKHKSCWHYEANKKG
jgi:hypothetical protein